MAKEQEEAKAAEKDARRVQKERERAMREEAHANPSLPAGGGLNPVARVGTEGTRRVWNALERNTALERRCAAFQSWCYRGHARRSW